jgi:hypothetical protein
MLEDKLLLEVINELESLSECSYTGHQSESISGGGGWYEGTYMEYFDESDRNEMVKKLKEVYEFFNELNNYNI